MSKKVIVVGSGFSGLTSACALAQKGYKTIVLEKNKELGGRARQFSEQGFTFDMGPSWYWMPEIFENFYNKFGHTTSDFYELKRLNPSYRVYFANNDFIDVPANFEELVSMFDGLEIGAGKKLVRFLEDAEYKYNVGMNDFVWKPSQKISEFFDMRLVKASVKLQLFSSLSRQVRKLFTNPKIIKILEFPVLFLGASPQQTPALYSLMNYADLKLGTWYPHGGMIGIVNAMVRIAKELGVEFYTNQEVCSLEIQSNKITKVGTKTDSYSCDFVVAGCDYHHFDNKILPSKYRNYSDKYWEKRDMAPSSLLFYLGINKKLKNINHHTLFFDTDFVQHTNEIYVDHSWPKNPLFYMCCPSVTDYSVAPPNCENLFILIPLSANLKDDEHQHAKYLDLTIKRIEDLIGEKIKNDVIFQRSFCINDFKNDYNSYKGNAYGLANTLRQTAILKPRISNSKLSNLFYTGQLTVPGPGVPPAIISGQLVANEIIKKNNHAVVI